MSFDTAMEFVFKWEGGYSDDPDDPGGETNFGISRKAYPNEDIKNMTQERAKELYYRDYWIPAGCQNMSDVDALVTLDVAINMGVGRSKQFWSASHNWSEMLLARLAFYVSLKNAYPKFIWGWINRTMDLYKTALWVEAAPAPTPVKTTNWFTSLIRKLLPI